MKKSLIALSLIIFIFGCSKKRTTGSGEIAPLPVIPPVNQTVIKVSLTLANGTKKLSEEASLAFNKTAASATEITINTAQKYQLFDGFGASLTGSAAYNLKTFLTNSQRLALFNELFSTNGIALNTLRITIGASDFSTKSYTYNDVATGQTDVNLAGFSLANDELELIPVLKEILTIKPNIIIIASPWSPPAWMKEGENLINGKLKTTYYGVYADYFVKYLNAMKANGINIKYVTPQNEPRTYGGTINYPSMRMDPTDQIIFIRDFLGPKLQQAGLNTKILCGDNNWNGFDYSNTVLGNAGSNIYVAGAAFHGYAGVASNMLSVSNSHPNKEIHFTEWTGIQPNTNFASEIKTFVGSYVIDNIKNQAKTVTLWNLALDQNGNPNIKGGSQCRGFITINNPTGTIIKNPEFYSFAHASSFIKPGAIRVFSTDVTTKGLNSVAMENPDGSIVLLVLNTITAAITFDTKINNNKFTYNLAAGAVCTFTW